MQRRFFLPAFTLLAVSLHVGWHPQAMAAESDADSATDAQTESGDQPHITVSLPQMLSAVARRFPLRYPVPGLVTLEVQTPRLQLLPQQNRVAAELDVLAAGAALERRHQGTLELDFALRYEPADHTVRAHRLRVRRLQFPTLAASVQALLNGYAPLLAERSLLEVVVHPLSPRELALADTMGLQPGPITVTNSGLTVGFVAKPL